jgi:hypothetical protein
MLPIEEFEDYLPSTEKRLQRYLEGVPVLGRPFPYNSDVCELPPEMMFMHEAVFGADERVVEDDLFAQRNDLWVKKKYHPNGDYFFAPERKEE